MSRYGGAEDDTVLSDRAFFGTGQLYMTCMKIPGDSDYEFTPASPSSGLYLTSEHAEANRYENKPTSHDLLRMIRRFSLDNSMDSDDGPGKRGRGRRRRRRVGSTVQGLLERLRGLAAMRIRSDVDGTSGAAISLEGWRDRIVQIDFSAREAVESREQFRIPGPILYLDSRTRKPMGIWESSRSRLFLPDEGRDWEHAKFAYRVSERINL